MYPGLTVSQAIAQMSPHLEFLVTPASSAVSLRKIPANYLPLKIVSLDDARKRYQYRALPDGETDNTSSREPTDSDLAAFQEVLQQEKEAVYRFAGRKFQERVVEVAQSMECMKHPETGERPVDLHNVKDIYRMNGDKIEVKKAIYMLQSKMWKENRKWALSWEKEYMQNYWKTEYIETDTDDGKKKRGGCVKDCIVRKVADLVKSIQDIGDTGFGEHIGERQPKSSQEYTLLEGGGFVVKAKAGLASKKRKATSLSSIIVTPGDDLSELTPNSWPTDEAMMVLRLLKRRGMLNDELIQEMKNKRMIADDFEIL
jgi:hypothetical protein